jgi:hypothetical protein
MLRLNEAMLAEAVDWVGSSGGPADDVSDSSGIEQPASAMAITAIGAEARRRKLAERMPQAGMAIITNTHAFTDYW